MDVIRDKGKWFQMVIDNRDDFWDQGYIACYIGPRYMMMFWRCIDE